VEGPSLPVRRIAFLIVLLLVAASLPLTFLINFQVGGTALALAAVVGGTARAVLPDYLCLGLLVRSRQQDVVTMFGLGVAIAILAWKVPGGGG
jgi:F0F1-type ATP synthase assembly protein I